MPNEDAEDRSRWQAQITPDPRVSAAKHQSRMKLYDDTELSTFERGSLLDHFIDPDEE